VAKASEPALGTGGGNPAILGSATPVEVAQDATPIGAQFQTATAVIAAATATQAAIDAALGTVVPAVVDPAAQGGQAGQVVVASPTPAAGQVTQPQVVVVTNTPAGPVSDCQYVVGLGETLSAIARDYNLTVNEIATANNITNPDLVQAGYPITIPGCGRPLATATPAVAAGQGGAVVAPTANPLLPNRGSGFQVGGTNQANPAVGQGGAASTTATDNSQGPFVYTIAAGDRLFQLSITYGVTVSQILAANPQIVDMNYIVEGQRITIPGPPTNATTTTTTQSSGQIIVTATPEAAVPQQQQPAVVQPTLPFTPTFTPVGSG
jgi:LysM repeat protein